MQKKIKFTRPREYLAFLKINMHTDEGPAYVFTAIDAYTGYAFNLGVERDDKSETILKQIYLLTEQERFQNHEYEGFTLIFEELQELSDRIQEVIKPHRGKVMYDKSLHNTIALPFMQLFSGFLDEQFDPIE